MKPVPATLSGLIHAVGVVLAFLDLPASFVGAPGGGGTGKGAFGTAGWYRTNSSSVSRTPVLALIDPLFTGFERHTDTRGKCPASRVETRAEPAFPIMQDAPLVRSYDLSDGEPRLCALIGANGAILSTFVLKSSGSLRLDAAAEEAIKPLPFVPARRDGRPVGAWHEILVHSKLSPGLAARFEF